MNRHIFKTAAALAIATMAASCNQVGETIDYSRSFNKVSYDITIAGQGGGISTKSMEMTSEGDRCTSILLSAEEIAEGPRTKGALVNTTGSTENLDVYATSLSSFKVGAIDEKGNPVIMANTEVTYSNGEWKSATEDIWKNNAVLTFVGAANLPASSDTASITYQGIPDKKYHIELDYKKVPDSARAQRDILLGYYKGDGTGSSIKDGGVAQMLFGHPLTSVEFKLGELNGGINCIKSISIENVYASGLAVQVGADEFEWSSLSSTKTVTLSPKSGQTAIEVNSTTGMIGEPFILIPQTFSTLTPVIKIVAGTETLGDLTFTATLDSEDAWEAGEINTYRLSVAPDNVDVEIIESVSGNTKSDVSFKNTGNRKVWIRAAIVANWFDADGNIIAPWSESDAASGTFSGLPGTDWEKGADGFYYYKNAVEAGASTSKLFGSYTKTTATGKNLQMNIIVQAVIYDSSKTYKTVWE